MKKVFSLAILAIVLALAISPAMAAKPQDVISQSNGYPSGMHFNLNIHGKDALTFNCNSTDGGNSIFVPEYGTATIQYVSNKKSSVYELTVLDACGMDGTAKVQLPSHIMLDDGTVIPAEGYYVFARILGKPNNGDCPDGDCPSQIILQPNVVLGACSDNGSDPDFGSYTDCLLSLGLIVGNNVYEATEQGFVRFDPEAAPGKGNSRGVDITSLFTYSGWVYDSALDTNGDGVIDAADVPASYDLDLSGTIDETEFAAWQADMQAAGLAQYLENRWIFDIADLVLTGQDVINNGAKLLQIRFYPVATTEFVPA
jgi:hypothetical protein